MTKFTDDLIERHQMENKFYPLMSINTSGEPVHVPIDIVASDSRYMPVYATDGSACFDIKAKIEVDYYTIVPRTVASLYTGIKVAIPNGFKMCLSIRSSLAARGIILINAPAQIDSDYRDEIILILNSINTVRILDGDRIAQGWIEPVYRASFNPVSELPAYVPTGSGDVRTGGIGSTGVK